MSENSLITTFELVAPQHETVAQCTSDVQYKLGARHKIVTPHKTATSRQTGFTKRLATFATSIIVAGALSLGLAACNNSASQSENTASNTSSGDAQTQTADKTITIGATPSPHAEILNALKDQFAADGYELKVVEFTDYVQPNVALSEGELDANYFQHQPYLDEYNAQNNTDLLGVEKIHFEPMALYAGKSSDITNIADGAQIAVPGDATNEARALLLLQAEGLLKLKDGVGLSATKEDISENPHNIQIVEAEAAAIPRTLPDVDFAVINGNYALSAGLDLASALATEDAQSEAAQTYGNVVAVRPADKDSEKTKEILKVLTSSAAKDFISSNYKGSVVALF